MQTPAENRRLEPGRLYRDLDGRIVKLLRVRGELCSWQPLGTVQRLQRLNTTHRDNFIRRFRLLDAGDRSELRPAA